MMPTSTSELPPLDWSIDDVRKAIPPHLFKRSTLRGVSYYARDFAVVALLWYLGCQIDPAVERYVSPAEYGAFVNGLVRWSVWVAFWIVQGLAFTSVWVIGHECGHGAISDNALLCDVLGFIAHSLLLTPYFSWKISHHRHHMHHGSMERDEVYVPKSRAQVGLDDDHADLVADAPLYTLCMLVRQQLLALPLYLLINVSGQMGYPATTSHYNPYALLFTPAQRTLVLLSALGVLATLYTLSLATCTYSAASVLKFYVVPWCGVNHWIVALTYLHHTDPALPHFRGRAWTFARGAAATLDRDFLGWAGRFFLHDVSHFHVVHHLFPKMPFYNAEEATKHVKARIGNDYRFSAKPVLRALWDNYNECQYVDDTGDVVYYRNRRGEPAVVRP